MNDWNQNGKYDPADQYVDYKIYQDMTGTEDSDMGCCDCCCGDDCCGSCCSDSDTSSNVFIVILIIIGIIVAFNIDMNPFAAICAVISGYSVLSIPICIFLQSRINPQSRDSDELFGIIVVAIINALIFGGLAIFLQEAASL